MRSFLMGLFLSLWLPFSAHADISEQQITDFVDSVFIEFQHIYAADNSNAEESMLNYYHTHFDQEQIPRFVLGGYGRRASTEQRQRFAELLPQFLLKQIAPNIEKYFSPQEEGTTVTVISIRPLKKQHMMVNTEYNGLQKANIKVRLRPVEDSLKILDVQIAGISMLLAQRDLIASMIKQKQGNIDRFLDQLAEQIQL